MSGRYDDRQPLSLGAEESQDGLGEERRTDRPQNAVEPPDVAGETEDTGQSYCIVFEDSEGPENSIDVIRVPYRGSETALDALANLQGASRLSKKSVWIARFASDGSEQEEILPVDLAGLARGDGTAVNHRILPNDRIFVVQTKKKFDLKGLLGKPGQWARGTWDKLARSRREMGEKSWGTLRRRYDRPGSDGDLAASN